MPINIAVVEDDNVLRNNLNLILSYYDELHVMGLHDNAESFIEACKTQVPDVVIMDINLPGISGIEAVKTVKTQHEKIQFLMCTIYEDEENIFHSLCAGASGYILKNTAPEKFYQAIKDIYNGGSPMSPNIARKVVDSFLTRKKSNASYEALSAREKEILDLLSKGFRYKEIAAQLFISIETVRTHIRNIYEKLQVNSRTEALNKIRG